MLKIKVGDSNRKIISKISGKISGKIRIIILNNNSITVIKAIIGITFNKEVEVREEVKVEVRAEVKVEAKVEVMAEVKVEVRVEVAEVDVVVVEVEAIITTKEILEAKIIKIKIFDK